MSRLLASRSTAAVAVGVFALLAAGGGYALASGGKAKTIHACVHKHGGDIYVAKKCAKHDKKISWNKVGPKGATGPQGPQGSQGGPGNTGPQGPGATSLVYNATGTASPAPIMVGTMGPWTLTAKCTQSGTDTGIEVDLSGTPGYAADGSATFGEIQSSGNELPATVFATSGATPGPLSDATFANISPSADEMTAFGQFLLFPTSGSPIQLMATATSVGSSPPPGATANTCHFSVSVIPVSAPSSAAASLRHGVTTQLQGPLIGKR
jgi:hypothetical protein